MFTGIVEEVGIVSGIEGSLLRLRARRVLDGMRLGESIAVDGACLTVVSQDEGEFCVELSPETIAENQQRWLEEWTEVVMQGRDPEEVRKRGN